MVLTKKDILINIKEKKLIFKPELDGFQLQPHAVDLRLGYEFHIPRTWEINKEGRKVINIDPLKTDNTSQYEEIKLKPGQYFEIMPREYVIATTLEEIELSSENLMAILFPRSSVNRRGLAVDLSGLIDVGYKGHLMIPLMNNTQQQIIKIYPGERICSLIFEELSSSVTKEESRHHGLDLPKYDNGKGFVGNIIDKNEEISLISSGKLSELKEKFKIKILNIRLIILLNKIEMI